MAIFIRTLAGKLYVGMVLGAVLCELLTVRVLRALGFSAAAAQAGDLIITQAAIFVLAGGLLWLCVLLLRRSAAAAAVALACSIGVELFFFGNLGVTPNLARTALCFLGIGAAVWWAHLPGVPSGPPSRARGGGTRTGLLVPTRPARGAGTRPGGPVATDAGTGRHATVDETAVERGAL